MLTQQLTEELDRETEAYLADILAQENTTSDALIRQLIYDRWHSLQQAELSKPARPKNSKQVIADFVRRKSRSL
jgi:hypothetical protein